MVYFYLGTVLYYNFGKIRAEHIKWILTLAVGMKLFSVAFGGKVPPIDSAYSILQSALWCFGILTAVVYIFNAFDIKGKWVSFLGGSTLHILLFQQIYFCIVGTGRNKAYIDLPIALFGGILVYVLFEIAEKYLAKPKKSVAKKKKVVE